MHAAESIIIIKHACVRGHSAVGSTVGRLGIVLPARSNRQLSNDHLSEAIVDCAILRYVSQERTHTRLWPQKGGTYLESKHVFIDEEACSR